MGITNVLTSYCKRRQKEKELHLLTELNHQLRTPLHGIIASLSLYPHSSEEEKEELFRIITQSAYNMQSAIDNILQDGVKKDAMPEIQNRNIKSVLIVEDNPFNQQLLTRMLSKLKTEYQIANNIEEAKQHLATNFFDIIFMDVHLPDGFGDELAIEIKKTYPAIKIYMLTADVLVKEKAADLSMIEGIIPKPFRFEQISQIIKP